MLSLFDRPEIERGCKGFVTTAGEDDVAASDVVLSGISGDVKVTCLLHLAGRHPG